MPLNNNTNVHWVLPTIKSLSKEDNKFTCKHRYFSFKVIAAISFKKIAMACTAKLLSAEVHYTDAAVLLKAGACKYKIKWKQNQ